MRTVFLGTSGFAAAVLTRLAASAHRPTLVVTRPDRPRGRGRRLSPPPVADAARELGLELAQPADVNDGAARERIAAAGPQALCVCAFGALIREPLLSSHPVLNVHPSLLPRWRGAAPIERAIMAGDECTGVSIMRVTAGLDSGPVCLAEALAILREDTYGALASRLAGLGGELLVRTLDDAPAFREQDEALATYARKIGAIDRTLDPGRPAAELERAVRALEPHIGARVTLPDGAHLGVHAAAPVADPAGVRAAPPPAVDEPGPGELLAREGRLLLGCTPGVLELLVVQPPGGRPMATADYLRGRGRAIA